MGAFIVYDITKNSELAVPGELRDLPCSVPLTTTQCGGLPVWCDAWSHSDGCLSVAAPKNLKETHSLRRLASQGRRRAARRLVGGSPVGTDAALAVASCPATSVLRERRALDVRASKRRAGRGARPEADETGRFESQAASVALVSVVAPASPPADALHRAGDQHAGEQERQGARAPGLHRHRPGVRREERRAAAPLHRSPSYCPPPRPPASPLPSAAASLRAPNSPHLRPRPQASSSTRLPRRSRATSRRRSWSSSPRWRAKSARRAAQRRGFSCRPAAPSPRRRTSWVPPAHATNKDPCFLRRATRRRRRRPRRRSS